MDAPYYCSFVMGLMLGVDGVVEEEVVVLLTAVNMLSIPSETLFQPNGPLTLRIRRHLGHCGGHGEWFPCDGL